MSNVELFENQRAAKYNEFVEAWIPGYQLFLTFLPKLLSAVTNKRLLVAGCGTGNEIVHLIRQDDSWAVTGVDPSPEMLARARAKLGKRPNIRLVNGLVADLPANETYTAATLLLVLHFLKDDGSKLALLSDIASRLEPDAPLLLLDITGTKTQLRENAKLLKLLLPQNIEPEGVERRLDRIVNTIHASSENRLAELCQEAGFTAPVRFFQSTVYMGWLAHKRANPTNCSQAIPTPTSYT